MGGSFQLSDGVIFVSVRYLPGADGGKKAGGGVTNLEKVEGFQGVKERTH